MLHHSFFLRVFAPLPAGAVGVIRYGQYKKLRWEIDENEGGLEKFSRGYEKMGFNRV